MVEVMSVYPLMRLDIVALKYIWLADTDDHSLVGLGSDVLIFHIKPSNVIGGACRF